MRVCLVGPTSPAVVSDLLDPAEALRAPEEPISGVLLAELARGFVAEGHDTQIISLGSCNAEFSGPGFHLRTVTQRRPRQYLRDLYSVERRRLAAAVADSEPDVVHAHWAYEYELAAQGWGDHFTTAHDSPWEITRNSPDLYRMGRLVVALRARRGIHRLSCVSERLASSWRRGMRYRENIEVIPNPVRIDVIPKHRTPADRPTVLEVSSDAPHKNVRGLLTAFNAVREVLPDCRLTLIGPGLEQGERMHAWARARGLDRGVAFRGELPSPALRREYERAWVFAHAAQVESFGLTVAEALVAGLPVVIGPKVGPFPSMLSEDCGRVADTSQPAAFARALVHFLADGPHHVSADSRARFGAEFGARSVAKRYLSWYELSWYERG